MLAKQMKDTDEFRYQFAGHWQKHANKWIKNKNNWKYDFLWGDIGKQKMHS